MKKKQQFTLWYFLGVIVLLFAAQTFFNRAHVATLSYSDFKTLLQAGKVHDVTLGSETIQGTIDLEGAEGQEIGKLIQEAHARVTRTLTEKRATLETLARLLLKQEVVERPMLDEVLKCAGAAAPAAPGPSPVPMVAASAVATRVHE